MIHSLKITRPGGPEVLKWTEEPSPLLKPNGVRIQVTAAGVNFADIMMRMGLYPEAPKPPFTPGYEISGKVIETGPLVKDFHNGDRVLAGIRFGGYSTEVVVPDYFVRKIPPHISDIEAAAIPVNFLTASLILEDLARVRKGDKVLIQSAAGGVGLAATQIAAQAGAYVIGIVGSKAKAEQVKSMGAHEVLTYEEWEQEPEDPRDKNKYGYQIILDSTGGESLKRNFERLAPAGRVISFGVSSMVSGPKRSIPKVLSTLFHTHLFTPYRLMMENKGIFGFNALQLFGDPHSQEFSLLSDGLDRIIQRFKDGKYKVVIGKVFPMQQGGEAHAFLQSRANTGKVILKTPHTLG